MSEKKIYLVAVLAESQEFGGYRVWGYYFDKETAIKCVKENWTDISELDYYHYGMVSEIGEGPMALPDQQWWFEFIWDKTTNLLTRVDEIEPPEKYQGTMFGF